jgi:short-subunit dehydrogenase
LIDYTARYGQWALVLGGSEGVGRAIAMELAARGMNLALAARRAGPLAETAALIERTHGVQTRTIPLDLGADDVIARIEAGMGGEEVGFVAYVAAAEPFGEFIEQELDEHLNNIAVNVTALTRVTHHFGREMKARGRGGIVVCSSLSAGVGQHLWLSYAAAKAYGMLLGEGLWFELKRHGVDACTLMISTTWTESFQRLAKKIGTVFAEGRTPANLPPGVPVPQLPEDAARNLFATIDGEWKPVVFANPDDIEPWKDLITTPREVMVPAAAEWFGKWLT